MSPDGPEMTEELAAQILHSTDEYISFEYSCVVLDGVFGIEEIEAILYRMNHPAPKA